jgi:hypothetical protein
MSPHLHALDQQDPSRFQHSLFGSPEPRTGSRRPPAAKGYYFSGVGREGDANLLQLVGARGMVSAARLAESPKLRRALDLYDVPLALDSGAFTGGVTLGRYRALLAAYEGRFDFTVSLDVLHRDDQNRPCGANIEASDENWRRLRDAGHRVRYVYHPGDPRPLAEAAAEAIADGDRLVCIGGLVPHLARLRALPEGERAEGWTGEGESVAYLAALGQEALAAGVRLHLLGVGSLPVLRCVASEPWYFAADSTVWATSARYGRQLSTSPFRLYRK